MGNVGNFNFYYLINLLIYRTQRVFVAGPKNSHWSKKSKVSVGLETFFPQQLFNFSIKFQYFLKTSVTTRTVHSIGTCWWIILFIGVFVFCWPILYCLCCAGSKDVKHFCPNCGTMLACKKRGC